jgi:hypothetical protein
LSYERYTFRTGAALCSPYPSIGEVRMKAWIAISFLIGIGAMATAPAQIVPPDVYLPEDISITKASPDLRKDIAAFSGKWVGNWNGDLNAVLVVAEIDAQKAKVFYAWGDQPRFGIKRGGGWRNATVSQGNNAELKWGASDGSITFTVEMSSDFSTVRITRTAKGRPDDYDVFTRATQ